jgi:hypothetical protein
MATQLSRKMARLAAGAHTSCPVKVVDGDVAPHCTGERSHYVTPSGKPVYHPNAYRRAFGKPVYVASTLAVEVGKEWLAAQPWTAVTPKLPHLTQTHTLGVVDEVDAFLRCGPRPTPVRG